MADYKLPEASDEFLGSVSRKNYPKTIAIHVKNLTGRINLARTLQALEALKRDVVRSDLVANFEAKEELRALANRRAAEIGFKGRGLWWS